MIKSLVSAAFVAVLSIVTIAEEVEPLVGRASVIDGDTLDIHGERIRINGVDAPESNRVQRNGGY